MQEIAKEILKMWDKHNNHKIICFTKTRQYIFSHCLHYFLTIPFFASFGRNRQIVYFVKKETVYSDADLLLERVDSKPWNMQNKSFTQSILSTKASTRQNNSIQSDTFLEEDSETKKKYPSATK